MSHSVTISDAVWNCAFAEGAQFKRSPGNHIRALLMERYLKDVPASFDKQDVPSNGLADTATLQSDEVSPLADIAHMLDSLMGGHSEVIDAGVDELQAHLNLQKSPLDPEFTAVYDWLIEQGQEYGRSEKALLDDLYVKSSKNGLNDPRAYVISLYKKRPRRMQDGVPDLRPTRVGGFIN